MQFEYGTPTETGRYDCVLSNGGRIYCNIYKGRNGLEAFMGSGESLGINEITQYIGPFPDPLPPPVFPKPFRRFNVTHSDGRIGTGAYNPHAVSGNTCLTIHWFGNDGCFFYTDIDEPSLKIEWIDEETYD